ncbi:MAG TPA: MerR family transcriptional regulator [Candidatus Bathyarchaeia archaeon]|nr:MerR family transcriptional regulator [Candidatus Bathyarchaeia archaeon]
MSANDELKNILLDFDLLSRLVVGIGEVSEITGVPTRQIRYWEEKGIIHSSKETEGTTRKYDYLNVKKILLIKELIDDGYTLDAAAKKVEDRMKNVNEAFMKLAQRSGD